MSDTILKGRVSYNESSRYVWCAEADACDDCQDLDGTEYENADDIPGYPHPNCRCYVEWLEGDEEDSEGHGGGKGKGNKDDEWCSCPEEAEALLDELEEIAGDAESLADEIEAEMDDIEAIASEAEIILEDMNETLEILEEDYGKHSPDCESNIDDIYEEICVRKSELEILIAKILDKLGWAGAWVGALCHFAAEVWQLTISERDGDLDKYRHAMANCNSSQIGELAEKVAEVISDSRELFKFCRSMLDENKSIESVLDDMAAHQYANRIGRERGRNNPDCDCSILNKDARDYNKKK